MRQAVGTTTILKIVLAFTLLFSAFLAVAIVYNKAYILKNEALSIIEKYEGSPEAFQLIDNYLKNNGYNTTGRCKVGENGRLKSGQGWYFYNDNKLSLKTLYCISHECSNGDCKIGDNNKICTELGWKPDIAKRKQSNYMLNFKRMFRRDLL